MSRKQLFITLISIILLGAIATGCNKSNSSEIASEKDIHRNSSLIEKEQKPVSSEIIETDIRTDNQVKKVKRSRIQEQSSVDNKFSQKLPFIGARFFNFYGGNGTGQSIMILSDGTTTVKSHGKFDSSVLYQGQYTNPLILQDNSGSKLLLKDNKILIVKESGEIAENCQGDGKPCESDLLESTSSPSAIKDGLYILGGTGQGLEVRENKYRYYDEEGEKEWREIYELQSIKEGLIFDGKQHWCLPPDREGGVCTENGWKRY